VVFGTTTDGRATPGWYGLAIPAIVFAVITVVGPVTGAALNPARYIGPMIARAALGGAKGLLWDQVPVYFIATFAAGLLAAAAYAFLGSVGPAPATASSAGHRPKPARKPDRRAATDRPGKHGITMVDATAVRAWVDEAAQLVDDNAQYLTHLDAVIGDADHGTNMRRGFRAAVLMVDEVSTTTPGAVLDAAGQAFLANLGGAAGPLYAAGFRKAAEALGPAANVSAVRFGVALQAALTGIQELGAAVVGDKTMVDAWSPAVSAYQAVISAGGDLRQATGAAAEAAERGLRATATMQARKGRASYIGARTIGHEDPGAASTVLILRALAATIDHTAGVSTVAAVPWTPWRRPRT
jgi:dihydroxyacetone kinase-like protein